MTSGPQDPPAAGLAGDTASAGGPPDAVLGAVAPVEDLLAPPPLVEAALADASGIEPVQGASVPPSARASLSGLESLEAAENPDGGAANGTGSTA